MNKYNLIKKIENFAPLETQEQWDCSGFAVETEQTDVQKIMLCLTVTPDVICQAKTQNCDMIISHHPLFYVPFFAPSPLEAGKACFPLCKHSYLLPSPLEGEGRGEGLIDIYCVHTNLDKAHGGTTDTLIESIFPRPLRERVELLNEQSEFSNSGEGFVRYVNCKISISDFLLKLKMISPNLRYVNNNGTQVLKRIAFCAGSGSEFINEAFDNGADAFVTGDLKFHTAIESPIVVFDIGHFESEILVLPVFEKLISSDVEIVYAEEKSPFISADFPNIS